MNSYAIITLSGFPDIFAQFNAARNQYEPDTTWVVVTSGQMSLQCDGRGPIEARVTPTSASAPRQDFRAHQITGPEPFSFPASANIGIRAAAPHDVFLVNDDVQFLAPGSVGRLAEIAHAHLEVGVLSPQFEGLTGNTLQNRGDPARMKALRPIVQSLVYSEQRLCFTGVYIRREVLELVGELDERFEGYGRDDDDYCRRVQLAGLKLAVTTEVVMKHGFGDMQYSASFRRLHEGPRPFNGIDPEMSRKYFEKWGRP